ncbi:type IV pilin protein [Pseudomonas knackmussii]|uniref:type IV pilin protein n=1 Tax=Pseudomonas knackmussii TaxID=65741 RepID=UPI0013637B23|nr:type IV pilin protein [Pseudomonas knackmussii]
MRKRSQGFTLIELMVVAAIVAILAAIAYPSYQQYIIRGKRSGAQAQMMDIANREQQYLLANRAYASKSALEAGGYSLPSEVASDYSYDVTVGSGSPPTFTITFTPSGSQASDGNLTLTSDGTKTPASKW